ncbi:MAG: ATP-dependent Clp protease adaptor ClpS [Planctomycetes bacterium]|nr:ATP-dependent Clp protease adaptor ClpS [Planctomycetota bacterium]MBI3833706.1 ATP-dependent Clp protease adaptor ClpS [Planctomycetota bacterium]
MQQSQRTAPALREHTRRKPPFNVILLDDNDHTYEYVIDMLQRLFALEPERAFELACEVDTLGRVAVATTTFELAELRRDQIHTFGRDWRIPRCQGSMSATIEPVLQ